MWLSFYYFESMSGMTGNKWLFIQRLVNLLFLSQLQSPAIFALCLFWMPEIFLYCTLAVSKLCINIGNRINVHLINNEKKLAWLFPCSSTLSRVYIIFFHRPISTTKVIVFLNLLYENMTLLGDFVVDDAVQFFT